ncbi:vesicular, overexpressed in cancer, prosurvival protein 1 isoform X2 [Rousettus aegyptiacus]|uniref:vesicular, overexpressed in cancer, prosurvival protein 1 isoform X2 n=1 Tax=Rousettus aegyptiacus TaxID=9407 RepID=UPI00168CD892|nr:vesicular, overexpressed in cancer, prosurvival protein 1 isoform X2 [Rousettus aegyptiacus]
MPPLRGLLRLSVLRAGPLHPEALVLLVPRDDGRALLLRGRLLHPQAREPAAADGRAGVQRVLHPAARSARARSPAAGTAVLHGPRRTRGECAREPRGHGLPGPAQLAPGRRGLLPTTSFLLQHAPAALRTGGEGQVARAPGACRATLRGQGGPFQAAFPAPLRFQNDLMSR